MGIVRTVLISTIDLRYPKSLCKNLSLRKFKKLKFQYFPLYFWVYSLVKIKVQFWEGRWPRIKKFRKRKLLSTKFYRRKHLSQIRIWFFLFLTHPNRQSYRLMFSNDCLSIFYKQIVKALNFIFSHTDRPTTRQTDRHPYQQLYHPYNLRQEICASYQECHSRKQNDNFQLLCMAWYFVDWGWKRYTLSLSLCV